MLDATEWRAIARRVPLVLLVAFIAACKPPAPGSGKKPTAPTDANYRPPIDDGTDIVEVPVTGINLGWGWDRSDAEPIRNVCVEFKEAAEPAQTRYMTMSEVSDSYELMRSMDMSAEASVKTVAYEVSGKASFAKQTNISGYSSNFVMNATVENGVRYATPAENGELRLTDEAARLAARNADQFEHRCGDSFVSAVYSGAKLTAVITIETQSQSEKEKLSAELSGSGWGAEFKGAMEQESGSETEDKDMSVSIFQTGGRGDAIPKDKDDLIAKLEILPAIAFDAPKDFNIAITPYETLSNWPAKPLLTDDSEFEQLASYWGAYNTLYDEIQQALDEPTNFAAPGVRPTQCLAMVNRTTPAGLTGPAVARLERIQDDVLDALSRLRDFAAYCAASDEVCEFPENEFRSPYAYRIQLPLELPEAASADSPVSIDALANAHLVSPAKRRCQWDREDPQCLNNAEISKWRDKIGFEVAFYDDMEARDAALTILDESGARLNPVDCSDSRAIRQTLFLVEPGYPAIWYHPLLQPCIDDQESAACEALTPAPVDPDEPIA